MSTEKGANDDPVINKTKTPKEILYQKDGVIRKYYGGMYGHEIKYNEDDVIKAMIEYSKQQLSEKEEENAKLKEALKEILPIAYQGAILPADWNKLERAKLLIEPK
jgi:hypothetical protein